MGPKSKKNPVRAAQNIDNVLFEKNSSPRLRIMVRKNEYEKIANVNTVLHIFCRYPKNFNKIVISRVLSMMCLSKMQLESST